MDMDKDATIRQYKTETMCKKNGAMIRVVFWSIFNELIVFVGICSLLTLCGLCLRAVPSHQEKDATIRKHKPEAMCKKVRRHDSYIVLSIFNVMIVFVGMCPLL
jgi:hypothetical protein